MFPRIGKEMPEGQQEEGSKVAFRPVCLRRIVLFEQASKESLREVLRFSSRVPLAAQKRIDGVPVSL